MNESSTQNVRFQRPAAGGPLPPVMADTVITDSVTGSTLVSTSIGLESASFVVIDSESIPIESKATDIATARIRYFSV